MREIKFRAWDIEKQKWYSPTYEAHKSKIFDLLVAFDGDLVAHTMRGLEHESVWPDRFILMQYTGLKDKKGKEIYEGDIVKEEAWGFERSNAEGRTGAITIEPSRGVVLGGRSPLWANNCEVIGNIYENPELLPTLNK